ITRIRGAYWGHPGEGVSAAPRRAFAPGDAKEGRRCRRPSSVSAPDGAGRLSAAEVLPVVGGLAGAVRGIVVRLAAALRVAALLLRAAEVAAPVRLGGVRVLVAALGIRVVRRGERVGAAVVAAAAEVAVDPGAAALAAAERAERLASAAERVVVARRVAVGGSCRVAAVALLALPVAGRRADAAGGRDAGAEPGVVAAALAAGRPRPGVPGAAGPAAGAERTGAERVAQRVVQGAGAVGAARVGRGRRARRPLPVGLDALEQLVHGREPVPVGVGPAAGAAVRRGRGRRGRGGGRRGRRRR